MEDLPETHEWVRQMRAALEEVFPDAQAQPPTADNKPVRIAVTDRGCPWQKDGIIQVLKPQNVNIVWVDAENVDEVCDTIQSSKTDKDDHKDAGIDDEHTGIDGIILTAWGSEQDWQDAFSLDERLLEQNLGTEHPVPLLAMSEGMIGLLQHVGGDIDMPWASTEGDRLVSFVDGCKLHEWAGDVSSIQVPADSLADPFIPSGESDLKVNATSDHDAIEGFEVWWKGALHVGTRFDLVELFQQRLAEDVEAWRCTFSGPYNIFKGFVALARDHMR